MSNTVKTLLYPFIQGIRLFSRLRKGKALMYLLAYIVVFTFEVLLFFRMIYLPESLRFLIIMYIMAGMIFTEFHFEDYAVKNGTS